MDFDRPAEALASGLACTVDSELLALCLRGEGRRAAAADGPRDGEAGEA